MVYYAKIFYGRQRYAGLFERIASRETAQLGIFLSLRLAK